MLKYVDKQKLKYNGHVTRHDYLDWSILDWKVDGSRGRGRPRRQWMDDMTDWLNMDCERAGRLAMDRRQFRGFCSGRDVHIEWACER